MLCRVNTDSRVRFGAVPPGMEVRVKALYELMGGVLGKLSKDTGSVAALAPVWRQAVGELAARHTKPVRLERGTLLVKCDGPAWREVLTQEEAAVVRRLREALGEATVARLFFEVE